MQEFSRSVCTEQECINVSISGSYAESADNPIILEIQSARNIADEALGPDTSCEFQVGPALARRWSAIVFAAYVAAAAENPRSELMDNDETNENDEVFLDACVLGDRKIELAFEFISRPPLRAFQSLYWRIVLESSAAAQLAEALLSASKIAGQERAVGKARA